MPRLRRKGPQRRRGTYETLSGNQEYQLGTGRALIPTDHFTTEDDMRVAWELHRDRLLPEFIHKHPGRRPFAWWLFDHGEERPIVVDWPEWTDGAVVERMRRETFGFLHTEILGRGGETFQEQERAYLSRVGLLTAEEK